jgi:hypothetical protein
MAQFRGKFSSNHDVFREELMSTLLNGDWTFSQSARKVSTGEVRS